MHTRTAWWLFACACRATDALLQTYYKCVIHSRIIFSCTQKSSHTHTHTHTYTHTYTRTHTHTHTQTLTHTHTHTHTYTHTRVAAIVSPSRRVYKLLITNRQYVNALYVLISLAYVCQSNAYNAVLSWTKHIDAAPHARQILHASRMNETIFVIVKFNYLFNFNNRYNLHNTKYMLL